MFDTENPCVLIVDDTLENIQVLGTMLKEKGFKISFAQNGKQALDIVSKVSPDLILLDIMMPELDGYETCRFLKEEKATEDIPVIFMSALSEVNEKIKGFDVGGVDYITKPFQQKELLARIKTHLSLLNTKRKLEQKNLQLQVEIAERKQIEAQLQVANQKLKQLASLDGLTQIANRRKFDEHLNLQWKQLMREPQNTLSLILCDVDYFKNYNDYYGHQAGDECLQKIARVLKQEAKRPADLAARYGGEEFAVILPKTDKKGAIHIANKIQESMSTLKLPHEYSEVDKHITLSLGICSFNPSSENTPEKLIFVADKALYKAKEQGRNQLVIQQIIKETS